MMAVTRKAPINPAHCTTGLVLVVTEPPGGGALLATCWGGGGAAGRATDNPDTAAPGGGGALERLGGGGGDGGGAECEEGMLTRNGPGEGAAAGAGVAAAGRGIVISFWQAGHLICIPAYSGPQEICCEQCWQENFRSLISQIAYAGNTS